MTSEEAPLTVFSSWELKNGMNEALETMLKEYCETVKQEEKETIEFRVMFQQRCPVDSFGVLIEPRPNKIPMEQQSEVHFFGVFSSPAAYSVHINSSSLRRLLEDSIQHFNEDALREGFPVTVTKYF